MIPQTSLCVAPGEALTLDCDPGGECLDGGCSWDTPAGEGAGGENDVTCDDTQARAPGQAPASAAPRASAWSVSRATAASGWRAPPRHIRACGGARPSQPPSPSQVRMIIDR